MRRSKYIRRILKAILFVLIFVLFTLILDFSFELDEAVTEKMLSSYSEQTDIETVFVGNSAGEMLLADQYGLTAGEKAFNMCTPSQGLSVSLKNIKLACSHHRIDKVVLLLTFDTVNSDNYDGIDHVYDRVVDSSSPFADRIKKTVKRNLEQSLSYDIINTEETINLWIPWERETTRGFKNLWNNLKRRILRYINKDPLGSHILFDLNKATYERVPEYLSDDDLALLSDDIEKASANSLPPGMLAEDKLLLLAEICTFCRNNNLVLMVIVTPHQTDYYERFSSYREESELLSTCLDDFISKRGFMYYNTEDDPALHYTLPDDYFFDWEHVDSAHKKEATDYLTNVIMRLSPAKDQ